jgi:hypothetical protein
LGSCFGATIDALVKCPTSIYNLEKPLKQTAEESAEEIAIPKQLWRIIDFIE